MRILFDAFELSKVAEYSDFNEGSFCEQITTEEDQARVDANENGDLMRQFWSIYGHYPAADPEGRRGLTCLMDFDDEKEAREVFDFLQFLMEETGLSPDSFRTGTLDLNKVHAGKPVRWHCKDCPDDGGDLEEQTVSQYDIAEIGIPICEYCGNDMEIADD